MNSFTHLLTRALSITELVDFHCHLDLYPDLRNAYDRCDRIGCTTLTMTTTPKAYARNREYAERTEHVYVALGLHPQLVAERSHEIELFERLVPETRYIGEIGLDASKRFYASFEQQQRIFDRALNICAREGNKIISIHSVRCARKVLDSIEYHSVTDSCDVVLHWFSANKTDIDRAVHLGCWFSVNERMLSTPSGLALLDRAPTDRLLTETDAPFLEIDGECVEPGSVFGALSLMSDCIGMSNSEIQAIVASNARRLLGN